MIYRHYLKRPFDIIVTLPALIILSPLFLVIAIIVRIQLGSPIIFRQKRPGYLGQIFTIYKFRTMKKARDKNGQLLPDDQRMTRLGRLLRSTSLDELPELFNVLKGEMSLVGPRPLLTEYLPLYSSQQMRRHDVLPGITGWAQVNGRNHLSWEEKFTLDIWYVDNLSFTLDLKIMVRTVRQIISREGINQPGQATVQPFTGEGN